MSTGLLFDCDEMVMRRLCALYGQQYYAYDRAIGLINDKGEFLGAVIFSHYNGFNIEIGYYGPKTMTVGIIRTIYRCAIEWFNPTRITAVTSKKNRIFIRGLHKLGFKLEGTQRCYYGPKDCNRNTGVRVVMFRDQIEKLALGPSWKRAA